jgi:2-oxoglutarate ferredoxin oxidoreductase subunit delta
MAITKDISMKELPVFNAARCKRCGICKHFCSPEAIALHEDGMPYLVKPRACTSCALCRDMCPDWAVQMREMSVEDLENCDKNEA